MRGLEKKRMGRGHINKQTDTRTCQLLDQLGPDGQVGEKRTLISNLILSNIINFQEHGNSRQLQYKEGLYVFEA